MGQVIGRKLLDPEGNSIGTVTDVIVDASTLEPEWFTVKTGTFGKEHLVPAEIVEPQGEAIRAPFDRDTVKHAPIAGKNHVAPTTQEREEIMGHFGITEPS